MYRSKKRIEAKEAKSEAVCNREVQWRHNWNAFVLSALSKPINTSFLNYNIGYGIYTQLFCYPDGSSWAKFIFVGSHKLQAKQIPQRAKVGMTEQGEAQAVCHSRIRRWQGKYSAREC